MYLWHLPLILALKHVGWLPVALGPRLLVVFVLAVVCGWASWRLVEKPAIGWAHGRARRFGGRGAPIAAPAVPGRGAVPAAPTVQ